jgi:mono/diheme cytochrome c family protein
MTILKRAALSVSAAMLILQTAGGAGTPLQRVPARVAARTNPMAGNDRARRAGAKLYERECAECHGARAKGSGRALPLVSPEVGNASSGGLFWVLTNGSLWHGMPSFAHLPEPERWQIVEYLKSLQ